MTAIATSEVFKLERKALRADFQALAEHRVEVCRQAICEGQEIVEAVGLLYRASNDVSRDEFSQFARSYVSRCEGIRSLAWIPVVEDAARMQWEVAARRDGLERFQIMQEDGQGGFTRAQTRGQYLPLFFIEPYAGNSDLFGLDLAEYEDIARLMQRSCDSGQTSVALLSSRWVAQNDAACMYIFMPVYDRAGITFTPSGRRENVKGYVFGMFDLALVVDEALRTLKSLDTHICLWHIFNDHRHFLSHLGGQAEHREAALDDLVARGAAGFSYHKRIPTSEGELVIECTPAAGFMSAYGRKGYLWVLLGGVLITTALTAYIRGHLTRTADVERQVLERTQALRRTNDRLTGEICEREQTEAQLRKAQQRLVEAAHRAGMADVATDVLHNVGNVLNSVNVSTSRMTDLLVHSKVSSLSRVAALISDHQGCLGTFLTEDEKGKRIPEFLAELSRRLDSEQRQFAGMLDGLAKNVEHIKDTITMQQSYAKVSGMEEQVALTDLIEDAIQINSAGLERHNVHVVREYQDLPAIEVNKQQVLQIIVNLVSNGKYALSHGKQEDKILTIRLGPQGDEAIQLDVIDNGVGIAPEHLGKIFRHGFTTKKEGHGFGLHSAALAAKEMGGGLSVHSEGPDRGATFTLVLPKKRPRVTTWQKTRTTSDVSS